MTTTDYRIIERYRYGKQMAIMENKYTNKAIAERHGRSPATIARVLAGECFMTVGPIERKHIKRRRAIGDYFKSERMANSLSAIAKDYRVDRRTVLEKAKRRIDVHGDVTTIELGKDPTTHFLTMRLPCSVYGQVGYY